ncbi:LysM peptidoglycan-binding domain-containing protein [Belliella sp. R4-6]|uniref:LysM peptidoglycan-binding domain-containing protein n=1 Tax=Belliella alkalica TaxID=1730871 RepID=A0ABS9VC51_9BACT|nr:LysM peptidoglycan-binding domain-containing protein [Belliella alkalica]MCH7413625.1 LysM peptidoglycan-binding domain-containing protein [Belliella alkalica]
MKRITLVAFLIALSLHANGSELIRLDSVGIEKVGDKTFIIHQVEEKETMFGISRRYATSVNEIIQNNDELKAGLKMGQRIRIPYIAPAALPQGSILHNVAQGETLFSISKKYNVSVGDIMSWNNLKGNDLSLGQALVLQGVGKPEAPKPVVEANKELEKVADSGKAKASAKKDEAQKKVEEAKVEVPKAKEVATREVEETKSSNATGAVYPGDWITHTVAQGETLFSVAKKYDSKVEDLINWNGLTSNNLSLGQKLKVGRGAAGPSTVPVISSTVPVIVNNERSEATLSGGRAEETPYKNIKETGLAEVIEGTGNHKKYLVLHKEAPVGTIMRVRNEENDITIFARVVGKLPNTGDNSRLVVKLSKAAFDQLRAVNSRFPVEVSY